MAIAASLFSQGFMRTNRFSQVIDAFFGKEKAEKPKTKGGIDKDLVEFSSANQMSQVIAQYKKTSTLQAELNIKLTISSEHALTESGTNDPKLDRDLDLILRMISKDEKQYGEMKARFEKLLFMSQTSTSSAQSTIEAPPSAPAQNAASTSNAGMTQTEMSASLARRNSYELNLQFKNTSSTTEQTRIELEKLGIIKVDPLVLDLSGEGINLTKAGEGAEFDIDADGKKDKTAWVRGNTAMLVYDRNGNGVIDDGTELFGDQNGAVDGFAELAKYDVNGDKKIDRLDPVFKALKLYRDLNGDGKIDKNELSTLSELGIKALNLNFTQVDEDINGNTLILNGSFEREDGTAGQLADVLLGYRKR